MSSITQLGLYNEALRLIGERRLASISENREPRRVLDDIWNDGAIDYCLEQGQWNFAMRAIEITESATVPAFGYQYAFDKPNDFIRTAGMAEDERFARPLIETNEEVGFWFANITPIYIRFVSNAATYGGDLQRWPSTFSKFVAAYLASEACFTLTQSTEKQKYILGLMEYRLKKSRSLDAMSDPTMFMPQGGWSSSRIGNSRRLDRGNRGRLIG
jgi:hypothetical protein